MVYVSTLWIHFGCYTSTLWTHFGGLRPKIVDSFEWSTYQHCGFIWVVYILTLWIRLGGLRLNIVDSFGWSTS